jgi:drug/metabolite transporter (DMT)-like permease
MAETIRPERKDLIQGFGFALLAVVLWSGNFIVARGLRQSMPPVSLAFFRWAVATVVLLPFAYHQLKTDGKYIRRHLPYLAAAAVTGVAIFNTFIYIAGQYTTAMNMALIGTTAAPVFVLLISGVLLKQRLGLNQWLGAAICIAGIVVLISKGDLHTLRNFHFSRGDLWILAAALAFSIYTLLVKRKPKELSATSFLFSIFLLGTIFILPFYLIEAGQGHTFTWSSGKVLILLYLGVGASVIAFLCWNLSIRRVGPARTALFGNLIPVFSSIEAALILREELSPLNFLSFLIIFLGLIVANLHFLRGKPAKV